MEAREMDDDTDQANQSDPQPLPHQFTTVFEYLINVSGFKLPFTHGSRIFLRVFEIAQSLVF
jgi:hypothetical protein